MSTDKKAISVVSVAQFKRLQARVKTLEGWKAEIEEWRGGLEAASVPGKTEEEPVSTGNEVLDRRLQDLEKQNAKGGGARLLKFRAFLKRHPLFWTAGCLMLGYVVGCVVCDFSTFGGY